MTWHCVYCNPSAEWAVSARLRFAGYETLWLHFREPSKHARRMETIIKPLFPRYVFVALGPSQGFYGACKIQGVHSIVSCGGVPEEIPAEVVAELRKRGDKDGLCKLTPEERKLRKRLQHGVKITAYPGSLTEMVGTVILDSGSAVSAWVNGKKWTFPEHAVAANG